MARTKGAANKESAQRKREILEGIWLAMRAANGRAISWREMATAGGVGPATLAHHFGKRDDVVAAVLGEKRDQGAEPLEVLAEPTSSDL
ncbi:MAG: hypothetical protein AAGF86_20725, partial [Pseudomonadota bacterium]